MLATSGVAVAFAAWYLTWRATGDAAGPAAIGYLAMPLAAAVSSHAVLALLSTRRLDPVARRFWRLLLCALGGVCLGYAVLAAEAFRDVSRLPTMPIATTVLVAAGVGTAMWAVARVPLGVRTGAERGRQWLDRAIAFLGCGAVLLHFVVAPLIEAPPGRRSAQSILLVVLACLLAVGGITKVSYLVGGPVDRVALRLIGSMGLIGGVVAVVLTTGGDNGAVPAQAVVMPLAGVLATLAVRRQWASTGALAGPARTWLPHLAITAVDVPLLAVLTGPLTWSGRVAVVAAVLVTALVAVRQYLAFRDNARLLREKRASEERLRHELTHDALTGLANRGLFRESLAAALAAGEATVLLVDLDDFKAINDSLGHAVGDQLLIATAGALCTAVGDDGLPVRLGGDEFAVLLSGPAPLADAVARRILDGFAGPMSAHDLLVHASIGIATAGAGTPPDRLLREADIAMCAAKQRGKANFVRYHDGMEPPVLTHARLGGELRRALDAGEFQVLYQPIMALDRFQVIGVEALVRWQHPTRGLVSPAEFIPAAEGTGLIVPLGRFVLREVCRQTAAWLAEYGPDALQKAAPNVSVRQLRDPDFVADVRSALADSGLSADRLVLELTESAVLRGTQVSHTLHELHAMGIRLALDDFGTGESSLSLLRSFPASIVKLDKSFVDGIELDEPGTPAAEARQAVARAVIQLAGALGLDTVAEGIENEQQADRLRRLGYTLGQGYHLARPMPADDLGRLLAAQRLPAAAAA